MEIPGIFRVVEPAGPRAPLLLGVPHAGRTYPTDFHYSCPLPLLRQTEDSYVEELVADAPRYGATILAALFPRALIDVNRAVDDLDPAVIDGAWSAPLSPGERTLQGLGLVRRLCRNGVPMYNAPLPVAEIQQRLNHFYHPYHRTLRRLFEAVHRQFGEAWLIDCHSMPSYMAGGVVGARVDMVLGDRDGASCDPGFTDLAARVLRDLGYNVALNDPYKGMEILRRHGAPKRGFHALQLEINRAIYLDEKTCEYAPGFEALRADLEQFFKQVAAALPCGTTERLAAE